jgi:hypothetical protein
VLNIHKKESSMSRIRGSGAISARFLILLTLMAAAPGAALARGDTVGVPENARAKNNGSGWKCDRGFRAVNKACVVVEVPVNAHLGYSGNDWKCNRAYRRQQDSCSLP